MKVLSILNCMILIAGCRATSGGQDTSGTLTNSDCDGFAEATGDPLEWLISLNQLELRQAFSCAPDSLTPRTGVGKGRGSVVQALPIWNQFQGEIGDYIWGGKKFYKEVDGYKLINIMKDSGDERYLAGVYVGDSIFDKRPTIVLDYRNDNSAASSPAHSPAQQLVDRIVNGIRDEIREIQVNGEGSGVFLGRAHLLRRTFVGGAIVGFGDVSDHEFNNEKAMQFAANFFLDFRE
jgi:hypothetical protein